MANLLSSRFLRRKQNLAKQNYPKTDDPPKGKALPTSKGLKGTKKHFIRVYYENRGGSAKEIAQKAKTTPGYVSKVLSQIRNEGKKQRGRNGRIFAHGNSFYDWAVMPETAAMLQAPVMNPKTGMKQVGFKRINPCSCQIHPNGHIIIWAHSTGWKDWLTSEFVRLGWPVNVARFVVESAKFQVSTIEAGTKPIDPTLLPDVLYIESEWGMALVKDNSPEKNVLEVRFNIPRMQHFLGLPEIRKRLAVIEQGSVTLNQAYKSIVALLLQLNRQWEVITNRMVGEREGDKKC